MLLLLYKRFIQKSIYTMTLSHIILFLEQMRKLSWGILYLLIKVIEEWNRKSWWLLVRKKIINYSVRIIFWIIWLLNSFKVKEVKNQISEVLEIQHFFVSLDKTHMQKKQQNKLISKLSLNLEINLKFSTMPFINFQKLKNFCSRCWVFRSNRDRLLRI